MRRAIITEEIITTKADDWSSDQVGQVTLCTSSLYESSMYALNFDITDFLARAAGLEPTAYGFGDRHSTNWATPVFDL